MRLYNRKAQTIGEYAILLALLASAFVGMQLYLKRGLQGKLRDASDHIVSSVNKDLQTSYETQFDPENRTLTKDLRQEISETEGIAEGGGTSKKSENTINATAEERTVR